MCRFLLREVESVVNEICQICFCKGHEPILLLFLSINQNYSLSILGSGTSVSKVESRLGMYGFMLIAAAALNALV